MEHKRAFISLRIKVEVLSPPPQFNTLRAVSSI